MKVKVKHGKDKQKLELYVLQSEGVPLFGCEWMRSIHLNWQAIKAIQITSKQNRSTTDERLKRILTQSAQVFQDGIGTLKHLKAQVVLEENATPKFHKARPVPYAIRPKVEAELQHLEDQGILSKVDWCEWATPIVPVVKKTGAVRICGDFKVTVNPVRDVATEYAPMQVNDTVIPWLTHGYRCVSVMWPRISS